MIKSKIFEKIILIKVHGHKYIQMCLIFSLKYNTKNVKNYLFLISQKY